jgi:PIN domain nuclease of toxin-antitoxin system
LRILLDTQVWIWMRAAPARLSTKADRLLRDDRTELFLSAASAWEIAVKASLGKLRLPCGVEEFVVTRAAATGVTPLPITQFHAIESATLPPHHRDPFDRMLVAQARLERLRLMTADPALARYKVEIVEAG